MTTENQESITLPPKRKRGRPRTQNVVRETNGRIQRNRRASTKRLIGIDGEGENRLGVMKEFFDIKGTRNHEIDSLLKNKTIDNDKRHSYHILAASDGNESWHISKTDNPRLFRKGNVEERLQPNYGLSTIDCLEFILDLPKDSLVFGFAFTYDVAMILMDLPKEKLEELYGEDHMTEWRGYRLHYIPRKKLTVKHGKYYHKTKTGKTEIRWKRNTVVWDVFTFFQSAFIKVLKSWEVGTTQQWERIESMKNKRGDFDKETDEDILKYCIEECELLVDVMKQFLSHVERLGLTLARYDGPGALAQAWMQKEKIKEHLTDTNLPFEIALQGYYGGRFEISHIGEINKTESYDINSAYPYAITKLPCLAHGYWIPIHEHKPGRTAIYKVVPFTEGDQWAPFPWRTEKGNVYYSHSNSINGWRWIWNYEVDIAIKYRQEKITVIEGWEWISQCKNHDCDGLPFTKVSELYNYRQELKRKGDHAEKCIKLIINSLYGKMAQSIGYKKNKDGTYEKPTFQSFIWAGMITSHCRAQILEQIYKTEQEHGNTTIVSIATDGIFSTEKINDINVTKKLGDWDYTSYENVFLFQSGIYTGVEVKNISFNTNGTYINHEKSQQGKTRELLKKYCHQYIAYKTNNDTRWNIIYVTDVTDEELHTRYYIDKDNEHYDTLPIDIITSIGEVIFKTRGFSVKEFPLELLIDGWRFINRRMQRKIESPQYSRFIGVKSGLHLKNWYYEMRSWKTFPSRWIDLEPNRRLRIADAGNTLCGIHKDDEDSYWTTVPTTISTPSSPYKLKDKRVQLDERLLDQSLDYVELTEQPE